MAIPHTVFKQLAQKRLRGKEGKEKEREIRKLLIEMPGYKTGPYGEIRKWLMSEIQENQKRKQIKAKNFFDVKREGDAQVIIMGPPNIGKSSLLKKLTSIQIKVANYAFTTLKPIPTIIDFGGALIQIVEIPGLVQGAYEGKGGGKAMLAAARGANYIILMTSVDSPIDAVDVVQKEMQHAKLPKPRFIVCNKIDLPESDVRLLELQKKFPNLDIVAISTESSRGIEYLKEVLWKNLHLIRIFPKDSSGKIAERPVVLREGALVEDIIHALPSSISEYAHYAKVWGPSAKFNGQEVGKKHALMDQDIVQLY